MEKLAKRKIASSKGDALLKPKRRNEEQEVAYILTDTKETIVTENFYQPISLGMLKQYLPKEMY